ncbi:carbohydrate ABC transporter permease [Nonomuraea wenchangensis]|uniref:Raffinose/stachyose/melibiose transport system permease protein n=1 Tax=Nonomuraea wenchangensis TaxID=568860 RepID=A0A1I0LSC0_9ACTN|nr:sugar ABC transporter permease [Nonomuraea wenchangensis]SEU44787.1 raffinose/stachyose/melibiose transport system permease protein [Nonomuraea wenchangensis]
MAGRRAAGRPPGEPRRVAYLYLLPAFVIYAAFLLFPIGRAVQFSLYDWDGLSVGRWAGLDNYAAILADEGLRAAFGHALVLVVFYALIPLAVGLALAAVLNHAKVRGLGFFRTVVFLPQVVAMVVVAVAWRRVYAPDGTLNALLGALGLDSLTRGWLGDYAFALPAVGVVGTWVETGLVTVLLLAGMSRVPPDLYEAARLDGAGAVREFFAVTLPSVRGEIAVALTLTVIAALRTFDLVYVTTRGGPGTSTTVPSYEVYHRAFGLGQVGSAAAVGVTLALLIFVISFGINRFADRGLT